MLLVLAFVIGATIAILICLGQGAYLIDAAIAVLAFAGLRWEAALGILIVEYAARRVPYLARSCVHTIGVHPLLVPVLFPGAVEPEIPYTPPPPKVEYEAQITSSGRRSAWEVFMQDVRTKRIRENQEILRQNAGRTTPVRPGGQPWDGATIPITTKVETDEAKEIAGKLAQGMSVSKIAESLPGFHPRKRREFSARVRAVKAEIERQSM